MKKVLLVLFSVAIIIGSCSKDQRVVNQLDGEWKVTSMKYNGTAADPEDYAGVTYSFEKCKVKKGDCSGSVTGGGKTIPFAYKITDKGTKMTITIYGIAAISDIVEHSKKKFVWKDTDEDGDTTETTIEPK